MRYVLVLIVLMGCRDRGIDAGERARLIEMRPVWTAATLAERCPRPALRAPITGDGSARLRVLNDKTSPERRCLARVWDLRTELGPCSPQQPCEPQILATVQPHADVVAACAPLYAAIEALAHASEACSPTMDFSVDDIDTEVALLGIGNAIRLEVAPLVAKGRLGEAARRVLDAMRFVDDLGRKATLISAMLATSDMSRLVDTLDELAIDPRLTSDEARAIAHDLDTLLASAPRFDAIMRRERVLSADLVASKTNDMIPQLVILDAQARGIERVCCGTLRACVEHLDEIAVEDGASYKEFAQRLARRDSALAFVRMQIELRLARPEDCVDPVRRRAILEPWAERAVVGDGLDPIVTPPAWQVVPTDPVRPVPRRLHCVPATL